MNIDHPNIPIIVDAGIATGAVVVPMWVYQLSAISGAVAGILGVFLVIFRLIVVIKELIKIQNQK